MRPPSPSIPEKDFFHAALAQGLRLDGRSPLAARRLEIAFGEELGAVEVALGKTRVLAHVDAKMVRPAPERPYEGVLTIHAELGPMAGSEYEPGRPSDDEVALARMLDKVLRRSDALDRESLCVRAGARVWAVRLTLHVLSAAGNVLDAAVLAGVAALRHFRRPDVELLGDDVVVHDPAARAPVPLAVAHSPFCMTFALYARADGRLIALLDPAGLEATLAQGTLSVALNAQKELCVVHKAGGVPLSPEEVMRLVHVALGEVQALDNTVTQALEEDWRERKARVEVR